jgi:hypothetical protein
MYWALCLSWELTGGSDGQQDRHKAPSHPHIRPLSLQDGARRIAGLACQCSLSR